MFIWGDNQFGQLGNNSRDRSLLPITPLGMTDVQSQSIGTHSCAIKLDGSAWCWGDNFNGAVGDGSSGQFNMVPSQVINDLAP